jgi:hypothetical protein
MSPGPTAWADTNGWRLVETLRIEGTIGDSAVLNDPISLALDGEGRIYVADTHPTVIKQFGADGRLIRTIGREGQGPGEFDTPLLAVHGSALIVQDRRLSRTSVFDTAGHFLKSWASLRTDWEPVSVSRDGLLAVGGDGPPDSGRMIVRYALDGVVRDTVFLPRDPEPSHWTLASLKGPMPVAIPLTPALIQRPAPEGGFLVGRSGAYQIVVSRSGRDTVTVFGRDWSAAPVSQRRRQDLADSVVEQIAPVAGEAAARRGVDPGDIPALAQAFSDIAVDGRGYYWVTTDPGEDRGHTWFDIFDRSGVYFGKVAGPPGLMRRRMAWGRDEMVAYETDANGVPTVVKYAIQRRP